MDDRPPDRAPGLGCHFLMDEEALLAANRFANDAYDTFNKTTARVTHTLSLSVLLSADTTRRTIEIFNGSTAVHLQGPVADEQRRHMRLVVQPSKAVAECLVRYDADGNDVGMELMECLARIRDCMMYTLFAGELEFRDYLQGLNTLSGLRQMQVKHLRSV